MKKIIFILILTLLLNSCSDNNQYHRTYTCEKVIFATIDSINVLGKSGNDGTQAIGCTGGLEIGGAGGAFIGGPIGAVVGAIGGCISGAIAGSFDKATDYEAITKEGKFICQETSCEDITGKDYETDGKIIFNTICSYK